MVRERPNPVVAVAGVVELHARDDERPGERPPTGLVRARDEAAAQRPVEPEELLPGALSRRHDASVAAVAAGIRAGSVERAC
jgi:hypothetical protein